MHEFSIAQAIVDVAARHAAGRRVLKVEVKVGHLRQVVPDSLQFAFGLLVDGTELEGAQLAIEHVPAAGRCRDCGAESVMSTFPLSCGQCRGWNVEVFAGEELLIDALELEDDLATVERPAVTPKSEAKQSVSDEVRTERLSRMQPHPNPAI